MIRLRIFLIALMLGVIVGCAAKEPAPAPRPLTAQELALFQLSVPGTQAEQFLPYGVESVTAEGRATVTRFVCRGSLFQHADGSPQPAHFWVTVRRLGAGKPQVDAVECIGY